MILDKKILSIDQSTSATKALLLKADGQIVHRCTEIHQHFYPQPDWEEHNPIEIWKNTYTAIRNILKEINIDVKHIAAMAITNQRETIVVWDRIEILDNWFTMPSSGNVNEARKCAWNYTNMDMMQLWKIRQVC